MQSDVARKTLTFARDVWAAHPSGFELKVLLAMTVALMGMALCAAAPAEIEAISVGNPLGARSFCIFLLISTIVFGAFVGAVDTTTTCARTIVETLPGSPLAISIRLLLTRLAGEMLSWSCTSLHHPTARRDVHRPKSRRAPPASASHRRPLACR